MQTRLLLIDDSPAYCTLLAKEALEYGFESVFFHNLEEGLEELIASRRIKAVVLDGRCYITPEQTGNARSNFVLQAIRQIQDIEVEYNRVIPFCVNTEHPADFAEDLEGTAPVFCKGEIHDELFKWLKTEIAALPETVIRKQYYDIFRAVENRFTNEEEELLIDVLQARNSSDPAIIITSLAILRRLLEKMLDVACAEKLGIQPEELVKAANQDPKITDKPVQTGSPLRHHKKHYSRARLILGHFHPKFMPGELFNSATELYKLCSKFGNHSDLPVVGRLKYEPGKYALKRLVFTFAELVDFLFD